MIRRLLLTYLSLTLVVLVGLALPLGLVFARGEQQHASAQLEHDAEVLAAFVDASPDQVDALARQFGQRWNARVEVVDRGTAPPELATILSGQAQVINASSDGAMSVAVPIHPGNPEQGAVRVTISTASMAGRVHQFWTLLAVVGVIVLGVGALIAAALARWIARPVRALELATRRLAEGVTPAASTTSGPPELRRLAATFTTTATRVQELIASQRSFLGHASHQLKTPLAAMRLRLENLEPDIGPAGQANLRAALVETDRLATMVDTLLAMTHSPGAPETVRLTDAAEERAALWRPMAADRDVSVTISGQEQVRVRAISGSVEQILDNLLSNALAVAPPGSTVQVSWRPVSATVELHVVDAGPGLSGEQRVRALEPFWRAPGAPKGGTGLGLALVRKLAEAAGGDARLEPAAPTGLDAVVVLPVG
ncbi:sensor histidine kinase [Actinoplanes sp. HUAS TT8]|uniref:sensor histidine kinase n=1 Tax=Actinoplanes sp. HUAS TT8 TaxID=3447453 RepID=UPI003F520328